MIGTELPIELLKKMEYDPEAPIKRGAIVYKTNSDNNNIYPNGTKGVTYGAYRNRKGGFNYIVEFKMPVTIEGKLKGIPIGVFCEVDQHYLTTEEQQSL